MMEEIRIAKEVLIEKLGPQKDVVSIYEYGTQSSKFSDIDVLLVLKDDPEDIENFKYPDHDIKMQKLYDIAYMQWNEEELANGEALRYILS